MRRDETTVTRILGPGPEGIAEAAALLAAGGLVAFPTETVYGLGADARNPRAVAATFAAKGRPAFNPLIHHVPDLAAAEGIAVFGETARALARAFWPGPLTLVLPRRPGLSDLACAGLETVAVRVPAHGVAAALLAACGFPVTAPSANLSGRVSPTRAAHVLGELSGRIAAVIDGGACPVGIESTIVGFAGGEPVLLRPGGIPAEALGLAPAPLPRRGAPTAPGQLASHYAPTARLVLGAAGPVAGAGFLGFGPLPAGLAGPALTLSAAGDLGEAAANLFAHLRALDAAVGPSGTIHVAAVPEAGLGRAINDRLRRAAAPRPAGAADAR